MCSKSDSAGSTFSLFWAGVSRVQISMKSYFRKDRKQYVYILTGLVLKLHRGHESQLGVRGGRGDVRERWGAPGLVGMWRAVWQAHAPPCTIIISMGAQTICHYIFVGYVEGYEWNDWSRLVDQNINIDNDSV